MTEKKAIQLENALIILSIAALWPAILGMPGRLTWPILIAALALMVAINIRRWSRIIRLREERRKTLCKGLRPENGDGKRNPGNEN